MADREDDAMEDSEATWARREVARMRQIMIGKARPEYRRYIQEVPLDQRNPTHPSTPNPKDRVSKRQFDRALGDWRRRLHEFDSEMGYIAHEGDDSPGSISLSMQPSAIAATTAPVEQTASSSCRGNRRGGNGNSMSIGSEDAAALERPMPPPLPQGQGMATSHVHVLPSPSQVFHCEAPFMQNNSVPGPQAPMLAQPPLDAEAAGIVHLRLADQLPEPLPSMPMPADSYSFGVPGYEPYPNFLASAAAATSFPAPWPLHCDPDAALMAATGFHSAGHSADLATAGFSTATESAGLVGMLRWTQPAAFPGQTQPAADSETPTRHRQMHTGLDDGETPPPNEMIDGRRFQAGALGMVTEDPEVGKPIRLTYEEWPAGAAATDASSTAMRRPTPPRTAAAFPGSPVPRTPPRSRARLMCSPSSVVKTPTARLLVPETPSPERFYPHHTQYMNQLMPPVAYNLW